MAFQLKQGFAFWPFENSSVPVEVLLSSASRIGYAGVDFLPERYWSIARDLGLSVFVIDGHESVERGFCDHTAHPQLQDEVRAAIEVAQANAIPAVTVSPGRDNGLTGKQAFENCVTGLSQLTPLAEAAGIRLLVEPLNSVKDHPGHPCNNMTWAARLLHVLQSPTLAVLCDVYHLDLMDEEVSQCLAAYSTLISHIHVASPPSREHLGSETIGQVKDIGPLLRRAEFSGPVTHEFLPGRDPLVDLDRAFRALAGSI